MSRSTIVNVSTVSSSFEFAYYTRKPAEDLSVPLNDSISFVGAKAKEVLTLMLAKHEAGKFVERMVQQMLDQSRIESWEMAEHEFSIEVQNDPRFQATCNVLRIFENVVLGSLSATASKKFNSNMLSLTTKESVRELFQEALGNTQALAPKKILAGVVSGFTCTKPDANPEIETMANDVLDWLEDEHAAYVKFALEARQSEFEKNLTLVVTHRD